MESCDESTCSQGNPSFANMEVIKPTPNEATRPKKRRRRCRRKKPVTRVVISVTETNTPLNTSTEIGRVGTIVRKCLRKRKRYRKRRRKKVRDDDTVQLVPKLLSAIPDDEKMETDTVLCNQNQADPTISTNCIRPVSRSECNDPNGLDTVATTNRKRRKRHKPRKKKLGVKIQLLDLKDENPPPEPTVKPVESAEDIAVGSIINFKRLILQGMEPTIAQLRAKVFLKLKLQSGAEADTLLIRTVMPRIESLESTRESNVCFNDEPEMIKFSDMFDVSVEDSSHQS